MWQTIIDLFNTIFGFANQVSENKGMKIPMQEAAIREQSDTKAIRQLRKQDRIQDRQLLHTPKILYHYDNYDAYAIAIGLTDNERPLYYGDKEGILKDIKQDLGEILTNGLKGQQRLFRRLVKNSEKPYYAIKIHPLTIHSE